MRLRVKTKGDAAGRLQKVTREIARIGCVLSAKPDIERVIVFGSAARGEIGPRSDIDLIIVQRTDRRFMDRLDEIYRLIAPEIACDVLVYTPEEFARLRHESRFVARVASEGVCIHAA